MRSLPEDILRFSRELRRQQTTPERVLWELLRNRRLGGFKFRRQKAIGRYIVDFYCAQERLAIELDGAGHAEEPQARYDSARTAALNARGIEVLRFWNDAVLDEPRTVLETIWAALHRQSNTQPRTER